MKPSAKQCVALNINLRIDVQYSIFQLDEQFINLDTIYQALSH